MKTWLWLLAAATAEVGWVTGVSAANSVSDWSATVVCIAASLALALQAARRLSATTVYVLFVGLGTTGTALVDIAAFDATLQLSTLAYLALLIAAIVGLKLTARPAGSR